MEKEWNNEHGMNRRRFLRQAVLAGSTFCVASTTGKAVGSEPAVMNILVLQVWLLFIIGGHWVVALLP